MRVDPAIDEQRHALTACQRSGSLTQRHPGPRDADRLVQCSLKIGRKTHGGSSHREPGAVGQCATPARIFKGKRLPGRMGGVQRTAKNLELVQVDAENNLLYIKGAIPGANNGIVLIRTA